MEAGKVHVRIKLDPVRHMKSWQQRTTAPRQMPDRDYERPL